MNIMLQYKCLFCGPVLQDQCEVRDGKFYCSSCHCRAFAAIENGQPVMVQVSEERAFKVMGIKY
jgi:hypothetical protein